MIKLCCCKRAILHRVGTYARTFAHTHSRASQIISIVRYIYFRKCNIALMPIMGYEVYQRVGNRLASTHKGPFSPVTDRQYILRAVPAYLPETNFNKSRRALNYSSPPYTYITRVYVYVMYTERKLTYTLCPILNSRRHGIDCIPRLFTHPRIWINFLLITQLIAEE